MTTTSPSLPVVERQGHLRQLLLGERDQMFLAIVKATFGEEQDDDVHLPRPAGSARTMTLLLSQDFKVKNVDDITTEVLHLQDLQGSRVAVPIGDR